MKSAGGGQLAHAYVVGGGKEKLPAVARFLSENDIQIAGNPDVFVREYKQFAVDDAREVRDRSFSRAVGSGRRVFILIAPHLTTEAQNALLKTLEEPPADSLFMLVVSAPHTLLPTVRSRVQELSFERGDSTGEVSASEFMHASAEKRLEMLKPLYEHDDDERDIRGALALLTGVEQSLAKNIRAESARTGLRAVYRARKYMTDKGSLVKALLEQVALLTPRM